MGKGISEFAVSVSPSVVGDTGTIGKIRAKKIKSYNCLCVSRAWTGNETYEG